MFNGGAEPVALLDELVGYDLGENTINGFDCKLLLFPRSHLSTNRLLSNSPYDLGRNETDVGNSGQPGDETCDGELFCCETTLLVSLPLPLFWYIRWDDR
jgi:hypothetical protein